MVYYAKVIGIKASKKLSAIARLANVIIEHKRKVLMKKFESQFSYCPLLWMLCGRTLKRWLDRLHERALRIACKDYESSFEKLISKDGFGTIHQRNITVMAIEMYEITNKLSQELMVDLVEEIITKYHTRSSCKIDINENDKIEYKKKSNYRLQKTKKLIWTSTIQIAWT